MCHNHIPSAFWRRSAGLFFIRAWVEFESTVTRQTLCAQHHDETSYTTDAHHEKTQSAVRHFEVCCGATWYVLVHELSRRLS